MRNDIIHNIKEANKDMNTHLGRQQPTIIYIHTL